jgi:hypothetical protein
MRSSGCLQNSIESLVKAGEGQAAAATQRISTSAREL